MEILVVEDDLPSLEAVQEFLRVHGHRVTAACDGERAVELLGSRVFDLVVSDVRLPGVDGFTLFRRLRREAPSTRVILLTGYGTVPDAVAAIKEGAAEYWTKPFDHGDLLKVVGQIAEKKRIEDELDAARAHLDALGARPAIVGQSPAVVLLRERIDVIADSDAPVLITGESGTGKELVARASHDRSARRDRAFVAINCAAFPETLLEAELFGHERGAFTGAVRRRAGRFSAADGGTLFLDEISEMPLSAQVKLLRVLEDGSFEPIGTNTPTAVDVRIVSATNRDLKRLVAERKFREDLYFRLNVFHLEMPPLRDRRRDLPLLVLHFWRQSAGGAERPRISPRAWARINQYPFPGNVRELRHAIEHARVLARGAEIDVEHLPDEIRGESATGSYPSAPRTLSAAIKQFEREYLLGTLSRVGGNRTRAALLLGVSRKTLWMKLRAHGITNAELSQS